MQVYPRKQMCLYNMFNHYFFDSKGESIFLSFLHDGGKGVVLVSDPPFGGMVEPLVATFRKIEQSWQRNVETGSAQNVRGSVQKKTDTVTSVAAAPLRRNKRFAEEKDFTSKKRRTKT
ncbi:hypothetical protein C0Q70_20071 [Pomacea canaliculata]|uniref:Uncharacterized protein n=1 Tax=Pomacea canaliculata TaxID=400727 RepID=A0A2T7NEI9_POMCA|nr:hypothetical protein C0Q70_20071 [Pomacea canaliculata]